MNLFGLHALAALAAFALPAGCTNRPAAPPGHPGAPPTPDVPRLERSEPAAGSTVKGPLNQLMLHFNRPARLEEVTITGPDGSMPMMITPVGEIEHYALPLSGLGRGAYSVAWRATASGREQQGRFGFTVR